MFCSSFILGDIVTFASWKPLISSTIVFWGKISRALFFRWHIVTEVEKKKKKKQYYGLDMVQLCSNNRGSHNLETVLVLGIMIHAIFNFEGLF
jgi:hypothetical protein